MTETPSTAVDRFLAAVSSASILDCDAWADDVALDATVPNWRFHRHGADEIKDTYSGWFADPAQFDELERFPIEGGEVVRYETRTFQHGVVDLLSIGDSEIGRLTLQPGWRWSEHVKPIAGTDLCEPRTFSITCRARSESKWLTAPSSMRGRAMSPLFRKAMTRGWSGTSR